MDSNREPSFFGYFMQGITSKYACFSGRADVKEFWAVHLFLMLFFFAVYVVSLIVFFTTLPWDALIHERLDEAEMNSIIMSHLGIPMGILIIFMLAIMLPLWSVTARRLRDAGFSPLWVHAYVALVLIINIKFFLLDAGHLHMEQMEALAVSPFYFVASLLNMAFLIALIIMACLPSKPTPPPLPTPGE